MAGAVCHYAVGTAGIVDVEVLRPGPAEYPFIPTRSAAHMMLGAAIKAGGAQVTIMLGGQEIEMRAVGVAYDSITLTPLEGAPPAPAVARGSVDEDAAPAEGPSGPSSSSPTET